MAEILLFGIIGDSFDKLDAATVTAQVRSATGPLSVRVNSPGGYVMEGLAIISALRDYREKVTVYIDGLAASMASAIAMVGDEVVMAESALMMVHKPWDSSIGNADDLRRDAAKLDRLETQLIGIYAKRTGLPEGELAAMLAAETWMTPEEALAQGFVTSIAAPLKLAAMAKATGYGFRHLPDSLKKEDGIMPEQNDTTAAVALERTRISTIMSLGTKHGIPAAITARLVDNGTTLALARETILDHLATQSDALNVGHGRPGGGGTLDDPNYHGKAVGDAIYARLSGKPPEGAAREFMGATVVDMAREMLAKQGVQNAIRMRPADILHPGNWPNAPRGPRNVTITTTTSDFPSILQGSGERFLLDRYAAAASVLKQIVRVRSAPDFRSITGIQVGGFGILEGVNEAGEFKNGQLYDRTETYKISTFGKMFNLSRQALINDDLGAFGDVLTVMGRAAAETEAVFIAALLSANPQLVDGNPVFSTAHSNLASVGAVPTAASFDPARQAMRTQKDLDGTTPLNIKPRYIVAGAAQETNIDMALATVTAPDAASVNPFAGKLEPLIEPRLAGLAWYLFGDPNTAPPVLEMAYLNGVTEPFLDSQDGWRVDGTEYKVRHDFGGGFVDWKGAYKNPGQAG